jgi:2-methylcitrate dehydratase PrpD
VKSIYMVRRRAAVAAMCTMMRHDAPSVRSFVAKAASDTLDGLDRPVHVYLESWGAPFAARSGLMAVS